MTVIRGSLSYVSSYHREDVQVFKKIATKANSVLTRVKYGKAPEGPGPESLENVDLKTLSGDP